MRVLLVGGIGYLGLNGVEYHTLQGDDVTVVALERSTVKRPGLTRAIRGSGAHVAILPSLLDESVVTEFLSKTSCPDVVYLLTGKIRGGWSSLYEANTLVPGVWARAVTKTCHESLVVYISSLLSIGEPSHYCTREGVIVEEDEHLKCFHQVSLPGKSKAEGEKRVLEYCSNGGRIAVLRLGLLVGKGAYHSEWRLLLGLAQKRIQLSSSIRIHATPARDVFRFTRSILAGVEPPFCTWINLTPWRTSLGELHGQVMNILGKKPLLKLPLPGFLLALLGLKEASIHDRYVIRSKYEYVNKFDWTPLGEALGELVKWCRENNCKP